MSMHVTLRVRGSDIHNGLPCNPGMCPIAQALKHQFGECEPVVCGAYLEFSLNEIRYKAITTDAVAKFINDFDYDSTGKPTTFELDFWVY